MPPRKQWQPKIKSDVGKASSEQSYRAEICALRKPILRRRKVEESLIAREIAAPGLAGGHVMIYPMRAPVPPAVVVFAGARDNSQLPIAFQGTGRLESRITGLNFPNDPDGLPNSPGKIIPQSLIKQRLFCFPGSNKESVGGVGEGTGLAAALERALGLREDFR